MPSFLHLRAWKIEKAEVQTSQNLGRSGGSMTYRRNRASQHSCAPSSILFTVDICTAIHALIFVIRRKRSSTWIRATSRVSANASSDLLAFRFCTSSLPYLRNAAWSAVLNSYCIMSAVTRCPVMKKDTVQFSGAASVRSVRSRLKIDIIRKKQMNINEYLATTQW